MTSDSDTNDVTRVSDDTQRVLLDIRHDLMDEMKTYVAANNFDAADILAFAIRRIDRRLNPNGAWRHRHIY